MPRGSIRRLMVVFALVALSAPGGATADPAPLASVKAFPRNGPLYVDPGAGVVYQVVKGVGAPDSIEIRDLSSLAVLKTLSFPLPTVSNTLTVFSGAHLPGTLAAVDTVHHRLFWVQRVDG